MLQMAAAIRLTFIFGASRAANDRVRLSWAALLADAFTDPRDEEWITAHGLRNSARVWMFSLKQPPRAVVLVWEFVSITPRDLTQ